MAAVIEVIDIADLPSSENPSADMYATITDPLTGKTYKISYDKLREIIGLPEPVGIKGEATPTTVPEGVGFEIYNVATVGTYVNFKDSSSTAIEITQSDLDSGLVQLWGQDGVWKKEITAIDLTPYVKSTDVVNSLSSTQTSKPLSAKQGTILNRKGVYDGDVIYRMHKYLVYDPATMKLKIIGSNKSAPSDMQVFTIKYDDVYYILNGNPGEEVQFSGVAGNCQFCIPKSSTNVTLTLSDIILFKDATDRSETHVKLAHITYNDGITSLIVKDYRTFSPTLVSDVVGFDNKLISNDNVRYRKRKWLSYDRFDKKLKVVGSDAAFPTDDILLTIINRGITYLIKATVGSEQLTTVISGNSQICIPRSVSDPLNVSLSDLVCFNDNTDRSSTHIKLAHITHNDAINSSVIIDYQDYVKEQLVQIPYTLSSSFINNSIGENNYQNGLRTELKILGFGNSFMRNSVHYLSSIAKGAGVDLTIGNLYTGGTNLDDHLAAMNNGSNPYQWYKYVNGNTVESLLNQTALYGLSNERWDVVILHQYTPWTKPFEPTFNAVILKIIELLGYCPKFYINATWAGHEDYVLDQYGFNTETEMWSAMLNAVEGACVSSGIIEKSIIPTGTAIQNARTLSYANSYNRFVNSGTDWHHLNPAGGFIAACTLYEKIIYPLNHIHAKETTFRINSDTYLPPSTTIESGILVTDANYLGMCKCAEDAIRMPGAITAQ